MTSAGSAVPPGAVGFWDNFGANCVTGLRQLWRPRRVHADRYVPAMRRLGVQGLGLLLLACLAMALADSPMRPWVLSLPAWVVDVGEIVSDAGLSGWFLTPLGVALLVIAAVATPDWPKMARAVFATVSTRVGFLFLAIGLPGLFGTIVKRWIGRGRPYVDDAFTYQPFGWRSDYASLPSGHAITAFAILVAFGALFPKLRPVLWCYALLVALSRIVVSAHFPSDVIVGAAFGAFGATLVLDWFAVRRLGFYVTRDGVACALPGPSWARLKKIAINPAAWGRRPS